jgi:hypothetical protein
VFSVRYGQICTAELGLKKTGRWIMSGIVIVIRINMSRAVEPNQKTKKTLIYHSHKPMDFNIYGWAT